MEKLVYSVKETAQLLGVCKATVERLIREEKLKSLKPSPRRVLVPAASIQAYLDECA